MSRSFLFSTLLVVMFAVSCSSQSNTSFVRNKTELTTPSAGWTLKYKELYESEKALICILQLEPPQGMAAQVISKVEATVMVPDSKKPIEKYVLGKTWSWESDPNVNFIDSKEEIAKLLAKAKRLEVPPQP